MNIYFMGQKLPAAVKRLNADNDRRARAKKPISKFLIFHWTPSEIITGSQAKYRSVTMPKCELYKSGPETKCRYDIIPVLIFFNDAIRESDDLMDIVKRLHFSSLNSIIDVYENYLPKIENLINLAVATNQDWKEELEGYYDEIACRWLKENPNIYYQGHEDSWILKIDETREISIGGM